MAWDDIQNIPTTFGLVQDANQRLSDRTEELLAITLDMANQVNQWAPTPSGFAMPTFNYASGLPSVNRPVEPGMLAVDPPMPAAETPNPEPYNPGNPNFKDMPTFTGTPPALGIPPRPDAFTGAEPTLQTLPNELGPVPEEPAFETLYPVLPDLLPITYPSTYPTLSLNYVVSPRPSLPGGLFDVLNDVPTGFTPEQYVSELLEKIQNRVSAWMDGQEALPIAIERALFERGRARIEVGTAGEIAQVFDEWAARGWSKPPGMLAHQVDAVRHAGQNRMAEFARDTTLKSHEEALANMRLSVQAGIQLEGIKINLHLETQRLLLSAMQYIRETAIAVINARVGAFNSQVTAWEAEIRVQETVLKLELAKLEEVRIRLEYEKLKGDLNDQTVRQYTAQWEAVRAVADAYNARINGYRARAELERLPIELLQARLGAFNSSIQAHIAQWSGFEAEVNANNAVFGGYRASVDAFAALTQGVAAGNQNLIAQEGLRLQAAMQKIEVFKAGLAAQSDRYANERAHVDARMRYNESQASIFRTRADVESAISQAAERSFQLGLAREQAIVSTELEKARQASQENAQLFGLVLEQMKLMLGTFTQLAASSMNAMNYSLSASTSTGYSGSRSVSFGYQGDIGDPIPPV